MIGTNNQGFSPKTDNNTKSNGPIFEHKPSERKIYPPGATIWRNLEADSFEKNKMHLSFMCSQFSCVVTSNSKFHLVVHKPIFHKKANYYKGKEPMAEDNEGALPTRFIKAHPGRLFKHEVKALQEKACLTF